jgi:hypothetical protein
MLIEGQMTAVATIGPPFSQSAMRPLLEFGLTSVGTTFRNMAQSRSPQCSAYAREWSANRNACTRPRGTIKINYNDLLEAGCPTGDLKQLDQVARKIELPIGDRFHAVEGPAIK